MLSNNLTSNPFSVNSSDISPQQVKKQGERVNNLSNAGGQAINSALFIQNAVQLRFIDLIFIIDV